MSRVPVVTAALLLIAAASAFAASEPYLPTDDSTVKINTVA